MKIGVIGVGGVGGYFGGKLAKAAEYDTEKEVYFFARNKHLEAIRENGLHVCTADEGEIITRPTLATDKISDLPMLDLCLVCVKGFDLPAALTELQTKIKENTTVMALLNGVDINERIRAVISTGIVHPACVYIGTHIESPGKIVQNGGNRTILLGPDPKHPAVYPANTLELFKTAKINYRWSADISEEIWRKYIFIAAFGMVTAAENKTLGQILENAALRNTVESILREIIEVGRAYGVNLPESIVVESMQKAKSFPYDMKTSFQRDFWQRDKADEREIGRAHV